MSDEAMQPDGTEVPMDSPIVRIGNAAMQATERVKKEIEAELGHAIPGHVLTVIELDADALPAGELNAGTFGRGATPLTVASILTTAAASSVDRLWVEQEKVVDSGDLWVTDEGTKVLLIKVENRGADWVASQEAVADMVIRCGDDGSHTVTKAPDGIVPRPAQPDEIPPHV